MEIHCPGDDASSRELRDELAEVGCLLVGELTSVLEQRPAQPFERGIGLLLQAPHLVYGLASGSDAAI